MGNTSLFIAVLPHGVAVATGLNLATQASRASGTLLGTDLVERVPALLAALGLPATLADLRARYRQELPGRELIEAMRHDKKGRGGEPTFVLIEDAGRLVVDRPLTPAALGALLG